MPIAILRPFGDLMSVYNKITKLFDEEFSTGEQNGAME
jgi:hypothetical protein